MFIIQSEETWTDGGDSQDGSELKAWRSRTRSTSLVISPTSVKVSSHVMSVAGRHWGKTSGRFVALLGECFWTEGTKVELFGRTACSHWGGDDFARSRVTQQHNELKRCRKSASEWLQKKKVHVQEWSSQSPDLSPPEPGAMNQNLLWRRAGLRSLLLNVKRWHHEVVWDHGSFHCWTTAAVNKNLTSELFRRGFAWSFICLLTSCLSLKDPVFLWRSQRTGGRRWANETHLYLEWSRTTQQSL